MDYIQLCKNESHGSLGSIGIDIKIAASKGLPDLKNSKIFNAVDAAQKMITDEICAAIKLNTSQCQNEIDENAKLIKLFPKPIYVEKIPNGYCDEWCCRHIPWFIITTTIGRFVIGWRKRIISIKWHDTTNTKTSHDLFRDEDVTKGAKSIHAWNLDKAKKYIELIHNNTTKRG